MDKKGFTLIEMIVAIAIISILVTFAVPAGLGYIEEYQNEKYIVDARKVYTDAQIFIVKQKVRFHAEHASDPIQYQGCTMEDKKTASFQEAVNELFACEEKTTIYTITGTNLILNEDLQLTTFDVSYGEADSKITVLFDQYGNAKVHKP